jgi:hypothetical protein
VPARVFAAQRGDPVAVDAAGRVMEPAPVSLTP